MSQEAYAILGKMEIDVTTEESNRVDTLRFTTQKLLDKAVSNTIFSNRLEIKFRLILTVHCAHTALQSNVQNDLVEIQAPFKEQLLEGIAQFAIDLTEFEADYEEVMY